MSLGSITLPETVRRLRRNLSVIMTGSAVTLVLGFVAIALNARALTTSELGILAIMEAFIALLGRLLAADTWQGMIKFGAQSLSNGNKAHFIAITKLAFIIDAISSIAAGLFGVALLLLATQWIGVPADLIVPALCFTATLFVQIPGAPIGVLRVLDRLDWLTSIGIAQSVAKVAIVAVLFWLDAGLAAYLYAYAALNLAFNVVRIVFSLQLVRSAVGAFSLGSTAAMKAAARPFVRFSMGSWSIASLNITRQQGTIFIVAAFLGPVGAAFYAVTLRLVAPITYLAEPVRQALYPELARLVAEKRHDDVIHLVVKTSKWTIAAAVATSLGAVFLGKWALVIVAGPAYAGAYLVLVTVAISYSVYLCTPFLAPLIILYRGIKWEVMVSVLATLLWLLGSLAGLAAFGVDGAGLGQLAYALTVSGLGWIVLAKALRRAQTPPLDADIVAAPGPATTANN